MRADRTEPGLKQRVGARDTDMGPMRDSSGPYGPQVSGHSGHGLLTLEPLAIVRPDVSWQLDGMSRWPGLVLS